MGDVASNVKGLPVRWKPARRNLALMLSDDASTQALMAKVGEDTILECSIEIRDVAIETLLRDKGEDPTATKLEALDMDEPEDRATARAIKKRRLQETTTAKQAVLLPLRVRFDKAWPNTEMVVEGTIATVIEGIAVKEI